ncbi:MAG: NAD(P)H-dependent oxidoreductase subunit E [Rhodobacterales bacterium]|nr:NAD(P)H-dependent oxidoreductase subunit E [Rhodobacterales bacterium]
MRDTLPALHPRLDEIIGAHLDREGPLLPILHAVQAEWGWLPEAALPPIAGALNISRAELHGVVSFYHDFRRSPPPRHVVKICRAEACQATGGRDLAAAVTAALAGRADVAVEDVYCLGLCACGPAAMVDGRLVGRATAEGVRAAVTEYRA